MRPTSLLSALAITASFASAQIPSGHYVVSSLRPPSQTAGGLAIVHPTGAVPPVVISGLSAGLTGAGGPNYSGANCVEHAPDGFILVGEVAAPGDSVDLHQILVSGGSVLLDLSVNIGVGSPNGQDPAISQIAMLANGNAVFSFNSLDSTGPLVGDGIGLIDRFQQTVSAIPIASFPAGTINGLAVDESAGLIYFGMWGQGTVWSIPIAGGTPTQLAQVASSIWNLDVDQDGNVLVCAGSQVVRLDAQGGQVLETIQTGSTMGIEVEHSTGDPIAYVFSTTIRRLDGSGTNIQSGVLSHASGLTVAQSAVDYGIATPGSTDYAFQTFPGVGGLPIAGNASYAVQVNAADGNNNLGVMVASFNLGSLPLLGIQLLVDPTSAVALGAFPAGSPVPLALPAGLLPTIVFLQSVHLDAGNPSGLAATQGLQLTTIL